MGKRIRPSLIERIWTRIERDSNGCWLWTGAIKGNGYANVSYGGHGRTANAHKLIYETLVEPVPDGHVLDHLCRVRHCVNPAHLEIATQSENVLRGLRSALATHCTNGHLRTPENRIRNGRAGSTRCRLCNAERLKNLRARQR